MPLREAIELAKDEALDLVEVSPNADPPVCRIMDFGKYLFEQNKKAQTSKRKQKQVHVKEIKFRPGTDEGDYKIKLRKLMQFLEYGDKTKSHIEISEAGRWRIRNSVQICWPGFEMTWKSTVLLNRCRRWKDGR